MDWKLTNEVGATVENNEHSITAGPRGPVMMQDVWLLEKLAHFDREVIPERRMHAKGWGAYGTLTVTQDITRYTKAALFSEIGKRPICFSAFPPSRASAARPMPSGTSAAWPSSFTPRRATGILWATTRPPSLSGTFTTSPI